MLTNLVAQLSRAALAAVLASRPRVHVGGDPSVNQTCRVLILGSQTVKSNSATENVSGYSSQKTTGLFQSVREIATAKGARFSSLCYRVLNLFPIYKNREPPNKGNLTFTAI